jgi:hypothetical protein
VLAELPLAPAPQESAAQQEVQLVLLVPPADLLVLLAVSQPAADLHRRLADLLVDLCLDPLNITTFQN